MTFRYRHRCDVCGRLIERAYFMLGLMNWNDHNTLPDPTCCSAECLNHAVSQVYQDGGRDGGIWRRRQAPAPLPSRERLRHAITAEWESSAVIATRAHVNPRAAGTMLAALTRHRADVERRPVNGRWEYRRRAS